MRSTVMCLLMATVAFAGGCQTWLIERTDRTVYSLIDERQRAALGITHAPNIGTQTGDDASLDRAYRFSPHSLEAGVPESFGKARQAAEAPPALEEEPADEVQPAGAPDGADEEEEVSSSIFTEQELDQVLRVNLQDVLTYAMRHARRLLDAKEDLYLAALDLTLERHLWTPQFVASVRMDFDKFEQDDVTDRALDTVSEVAVSQRLPLGGDLTARVIHSLVRDVGELVSKGEGGQVILDAQIPLLRGAGRVAYESRYRAERELIYAVRRYERFRRSFLVNIAADYLNLQQAKTRIINTYESYLSRKLLSEKADFVHHMGRSDDIRDAPRAKANLRSAEADLVSTKEGYETALDRFKIRIGMAVGELLDVVDQGQDEGTQAVDDLLPDITMEDATQVAIRYRLDLLNSLDRVDDVRRGVVIAKNRILPDLDLTGRVTMTSDPNQLRAGNFRDERVSWQGGVQFRIDDRKTERNAYRASLVGLGRAQRDHEEFVDLVRADVRRALRRVKQQENLRVIEGFNVKENTFRLDGARAQVDLGRADNQDVVDAENVLLAAQNQLAAAVAQYRIAILEFRRDTGTLRITDDGRWDNTPMSPGAPGVEPHAPDDG